MGRKKKYLTEEERKAAKKEYKRKWYNKNKEKSLEYSAKYYTENKEKRKEYNTERAKKYYEKNKSIILEKCAEYRDKNREIINNKLTEYRSTQRGRAVCLLGGYRKEDRKHNRGECTLTADWIIENIFTKPCHYCGETDWTKLGCDRIDNSKPHTEDNVVPCCGDCNTKKHLKDYEEFKKEMGVV